MRPARLTAALPLVAALFVFPSCASIAPPSGVSSGASEPAGASSAGPVEATSEPDALPPGRDFENLDACAILTQADAETLMGRELSEPLAANNPDVAGCTYPGDPNGPTAQVEIYIGPGAEKQLHIDRQLDHEFTQVAGLGDEAWQEEGMIFARTGQDWVSIRVVTLSDLTPFVTPLQSAMRVALTRL